MLKPKNNPPFYIAASKFWIPGGGLGVEGHLLVFPVLAPRIYRRCHQFRRSATVLAIHC